MELNLGQAITYSEVKAFADLRGIRLSPDEVKLIIGMYREINEAGR